MFTSLSPNKALLRVAPTCSFPQTCFWTHDWQHKALKTQLRVWFTSLVSSMYLLVPTTHDRFQHPKSIWELTFPFQLLPVASPSLPHVIIPGVSARFFTLTWTALPLPFCFKWFYFYGILEPDCLNTWLHSSLCRQFSMFAAVLTPAVPCVLAGYWIGCVWTLTRRNYYFYRIKIFQKTVYLHYSVSFLLIFF